MIWRILPSDLLEFITQAQEKGIEVPSVEEMASEDLSSLTAPTELRLMCKLSDFPTALANGTEDLSPLALVTYLKELAADFHSFYNAERVLVDDEKLRNARLALLVATRQVLRTHVAAHQEVSGFQQGDPLE